LVLLRGEEKGYKKVTLEAEHLDVNWPSEFAKIWANDSCSLSDMEILDDVLNITKKLKTFSTPAKKASTDLVMEKLSILESTLDLISDASQLQINTEGEVISNDFTFERGPYEEFCGSVFDKLEILIENAKCVSDILLGLQPFVEGQTKPIEHLVSGMRLELSSLEALVGEKT
jgi:hypothetical protein